MSTDTIPALELTDVSLELGDGDSRVRALDEVSLTLLQSEDIKRYEQRRRELEPWLFT